MVSIDFAVGPIATVNLALCPPVHAETGTMKGSRAPACCCVGAPKEPAASPCFVLPTRFSHKVGNVVAQPRDDGRECDGRREIGSPAMFFQ